MQNNVNVVYKESHSIIQLIAAVLQGNTRAKETMKAQAQEFFHK